MKTHQIIIINIILNAGAYLNYNNIYYTQYVFVIPQTFWNVFFFNLFVFSYKRLCLMHYIIYWSDILSVNYRLFNGTITMIFWMWQVKNLLKVSIKLSKESTYYIIISLRNFNVTFWLLQ